VGSLLYNPRPDPRRQRDRHVSGAELTALPDTALVPFRNRQIGLSSVSSPAARVLRD
jgi:hypothetical protein